MKLKLPLKKNRQIPFLAFLSQVKLLMAFAFFMFLQTGFAQVTITPWKINKGGGAINYSLSSHGNPLAYSQMNIPNISDTNWIPAPLNRNGEINFSVRSILSRCLQQLDFTYFETFVNIPANFNVSNLNVSFTAADDGARAYIFNSSHPNGAFIGEIRLGQTAITANYASLTVSGESNRLVIVQFDDCPSGNNLIGAKVNVNGQTVAINNGGCTTSNFFWSNPPTVNGKTATGTINGVAYTYTSSVNVRTTSNVFHHYLFPTSFNVPNNNPTIQNIEASTNTLTFASPMTNPVLVFSSIGGNVSVPINFSAPVEVLWSTHTGAGSSFVQNSPTQITGKEAFTIVRMNGTFSSISFDYLVYENYVNFVFGADFSTTTPDTMVPTVTLNGSATQTINASAPYTDLGATVTDNCDASPTLMVSGSVDVNVPRTYTLNYNAVDASGNVSTQITRTVIVQDVTKPIVHTKPITVNLDVNGNVSITPQQIDNGSTDDSGSLTLSLDAGQGNFTCANVGPNTVTLVATDASGNTGTATAQVTVVDAIAPTVAVQNINVDLDVNGLGSIVASQIDAGSTDNCGIQSVTVSPNTFDCTNVGANTVTLTVTDVHGNVSTGTATVTVRDLIAPVVVTQNVTVTLDVNGLGSITAQQIDNGSHDACGIDPASLSLSGPRRGQTIDPANITCADLGTHSVTFSVADIHGNVSSTSVTITVVDTTVPVIVTPLDINITATSAQGALVTYTAPVGTDNCTPTTTMTAGLASGATFPIGTTLVTYTVTDASGNTASSSFNVIVVGVAPVIVSLGDITQNTDAGQCGALVSYTATETVGIPASTITYTIAPGSNFTLGTTAVTATATNAIGSSSTTFNVIVQDVTAPTVIAKPITVQLDANGNATITPQQIDNGSSDNCGPVTLSLDQTNFSCADVAGGGTCGANSLLFNGTGIALAGSGIGITDISNNGFTLESWVYPTAYGLNSIIRKTGDYNLYLNGSVLTAEVWADASSNWKIVTGPSGVALNQWTHVAFTWNGTSGQFYVNGTQSAGTIATNGVINGNEPLGIGSSNIYHQSFSGQIDDVRIWSVVRSAVDINNSKSACLLGSEAGLAAYYKIEAGTGTTLTDYSINHNNATISGVGWSTNAATHTNSGNTVTLTVTDPSGNTATATAVVTVVDVTSPTVITQPITVQLDAAGNATITPQQIDNGSSDNCGPVTLSLDAGQGNFTCANIGTTNTVTLAVTDSHGNTATGTAIVTVVDSIAPTVTTQDITVQLDALGNATIAAADIDNGSSDNCGAVTLSLDAGQGNFTCANVGTTNTVTLAVTDSHGNTATGTAIVTVVDVTAPTVVTQNVTVQLDATGVATVTAQQFDGGSTDACGIVSYALGVPRGVTIDPSNLTCTDVGTHNVTLTVTDIHGNAATGQATITVVDVTAPIVITQNVTVQLDATGVATVTAQQFDGGSTDACGIASYALGIPRGGTIDPSNLSCADVGTHNVTLTVTDIHGNAATGSATVTVVDVTAPTVITQNITINLDATGAASITTAQIDNGSFDNCAVVLSLDSTSFSCANVGANTVTLTGTDPSGNTATATAVVTVVDAIAPTVITQNITINLDATGVASITTAQIDNGSFDNCSVVLSLDITSFSCENVGPNTVTLTGTDPSGNTATATAVVTVVDAIVPTVVAQAITVNLDANGAASITTMMIDNGSFDNCSVALSLDLAAFSCENVGANTVTLTGTDPSGNTATATAVVTVVDAIAPTVITQAFTTTITGGVATVTPQDVDGGSYDNCGIASMFVSPNTFVCGDQGNHTVTLTVTDNSDNVSTSNVIVTVVGFVPTISIDTFTAVPTQNTNTVYLGYGPQSITLSTNTTGGEGFTYSWTSSTGEIVSSVANPTVSPLVSTTYTVVVTNANGCDATSSIEVCVIDARAIDEDGEYDGEVLVCKGRESDDDQGDDDDDHHYGPKTKEVEQEDVREYLEEGGILGGCNATCSTVYVEVIVENDDNDHGDDDYNDHADNDDHNDHADKDDDDKGKDDDKSKDSKIKTVIYPNPVVDEVTVSLNKKGEGIVEIYNDNGQRIYKKKVKNLKKGVKYNMRGKKTGSYFVRIKHKDKVYTTIIFKKR